MTTSVIGRGGRRVGFTLIEILVVISLLVILIAALVANTIAVSQPKIADGLVHVT